MNIKELVKEALDFEARHKEFKTRNDKIIALKEAKRIILSINDVYKRNRDEKLMNIMKRVSVIKIKLEKRLKIR